MAKQVAHSLHFFPRRGPGPGPGGLSLSSCYRYWVQSQAPPAYNTHADGWYLSLHAVVAFTDKDKEIYISILSCSKLKC